MSEYERRGADPRDEKESGGMDALGLLSLSIALFSLCIAGASAFFTYRTRVDRLHHVIVEDLYETFEEWNARTLELMLAERAMADVVFDAYDELLLDLAAADASGEEFRIQATETAMEEFEGRLLLNPRLRHLWYALDEDRRRPLRRAGRIPGTHGARSGRAGPDPARAGRAPHVRRLTTLAVSSWQRPTNFRSE